MSNYSNLVYNTLRDGVSASAQEVAEKADVSVSTALHLAALEKRGLVRSTRTLRISMWRDVTVNEYSLIERRSHE